MLRQRQKSIGIALAIFSLFLFGINNSSEAIQIVEFRSYYDTHEEYDYGDPYFTFYVQTDVPYDKFIWYVYDYDTEETREVGSNHGCGVKAEHYFSISDLYGETKGKKYVIGVKALKKVRIGDREWMSYAIDTYNFRVFKVTLARNNGTGRNTGASGHAKIFRHYHNGEDIVMDSYAYAFNPRNNPKAKDPNDNPLRVNAWFRVIEYAEGPNEEPGNAKKEHGRDTKPEEIVNVGGRSQYYSPDHEIVGVHLGGLIKEGVRLYYDAHTHLTVSTSKGLHREDHWEADTLPQKFTYMDNPF